MITNVLILLWLLLIITIFTVVVKKVVNKSSIYPFQNLEKADLPIISISSNGYQLLMIVDSAAAVSIIKKSSLDNLEYNFGGRDVDLIAAATGQYCPTSAVSIPIDINGKSVYSDFAVQNVDDFANYKKNYGIEIDGLLGAEFFKLTKGVINFTKQRVEFP